MTPGKSHYNMVPLVCIGILGNGTKVVSVTFLVTVNDTWYPDEYNTTCLQTVKTPPLRPNTPYNESQPIQVGKCDHGPLTYTIGSEYSLGKLVPTCILTPDMAIAWLCSLSRFCMDFLNCHSNLLYCKQQKL